MTTTIIPMTEVITKLNHSGAVTFGEVDVATTAGRDVADDSNPFCDPCDRQTAELILGIVLALLIIVSNVFCIRISYQHTSVHHPENKYFVLNLAVCNLLCGCALLLSYLLDYVINKLRYFDERVLPTVCMVWCPIYKTCVMVPYVAVATLGFDIAFYCHHSMDYHRFMSCRRLVLMLAASWLYTFAVVGAIMISDSSVFCDNLKYKMNPFNILFPILLMFLPASLLVSVFVFIICRHWRSSHALTPQVGNIQCDDDTATGTGGGGGGGTTTVTSTGGSGGGGGNTSATLQSHVTISKRSGSVCTYANRSRRRLVGRFIAKFLHLIICSIIFALVITFLTVAEVIVEHDNERYCVIFLLDRLFISFNSLLGPWIYCFAAKRYRKGLRRRFSSILGTKSRKRNTSEFVTYIHSSRPT